MGALKDIVDLTKELEARAKERRDMDIIHKIQSLAFSFQSNYADTVERDVRLMEENAELKRKLAEVQFEEIRFHGAIEFRKGPCTGSEWMPFCPKCKLPLIVNRKRREVVQCADSDECGWYINLDADEYDAICAGLPK